MSAGSPGPWRRRCKACEREYVEDGKRPVQRVRSGKCDDCFEYDEATVETHAAPFTPPREGRFDPPRGWSAREDRESGSGAPR